MKKGLISSLIYAAVYLLIILLAWTVCSLVIANEAVLPSVQSVFSTLASVLVTEEFLGAFGSTVLHTLIGFVIAFGVGFALAVLAKRFDPVKKLCSPLVSTVRILPTMAIALIVYLWTSALVAPALVSVIVVMPVVYTQSLIALSSVDSGVLEMARVYGVPTHRIISKIYLPMTGDAIVETIATGLSLTLKVVVASEVLVGSGDSMGQIMYLAQNLYSNSALLFAAVIWVVIVGFVLEWGIRLAYFGIKRGVYAKKYDNK